MFAIELSYRDRNQTDLFTVRRPVVRIGGDSTCHVSIPELASKGIVIQLETELSNRFKVTYIGSDSQSSIYYTSANLKLDHIKLDIIKVDYDLIVKNGESVDKASARILKQAISKRIPEFPALIVRGENKFIFSIANGTSVLIGRSEDCEIILDSPDISGKHCRVGYENGKFWIEDLGSTNGTYVNRAQVSGKIEVKDNTPIILGLKNSLIGVSNEVELEKSTKLRSENILKPSERRFPVLVSVSEIARPARLVIPLEGKVSIGRDPSNDIWLGVPHVSRKHCEVYMSGNKVVVVDHSTNGTMYSDGKLTNGNSLVVESSQILSFGEELTVGICFDDEQERAFFRAKGNPQAILRSQNNNGRTVASQQQAKVTQTLEPEFMENTREQMKNKPSLQEIADFYGSLSSNNKFLLFGAILGLFLVFAIVVMLIVSMV